MACLLSESKDALVPPKNVSHSDVDDDDDDLTTFTILEAHHRLYGAVQISLLMLPLPLRADCQDAHNGNSLQKFRVDIWCVNF